MKILIFLVMAIALVVLWQDNKTKTAKLNDLETRADNADQQSISAGQKVQMLEAQVAQLRAQLGQTQGSSTLLPQQTRTEPRQQPSWFSNQLNGSQPSLLDPHGGPP